MSLYQCFFNVLNTLLSTAVPENKLFIGMLSRKAGENEVREIFSPFGEIREIYMIRNADGSSKCAAFLRYVERDSAVNAIENLNHSAVMDGATRPLIVKFADNKQQRQARQMRNSRRDHMLAAMRATPPFPGYPVSAKCPNIMTLSCRSNPFLSRCRYQAQWVSLLSSSYQATLPMVPMAPEHLRLLITHHLPHTILICIHPTLWELSHRIHIQIDRKCEHQIHDPGKAQLVQTSLSITSPMI